MIMVDTYRAVRQFERMMGHSYEELMQPTQHIPPLKKGQEGKLIATIVEVQHRDNQGNIIDREIRYERPDGK